MRRKLSLLLTGKDTASWDLDQARGQGQTEVTALPGLSPSSSFTSSRASSAMSSETETPKAVANAKGRDHALVAQFDQSSVPARQKFGRCLMPVRTL